MCTTQRNLAGGRTAEVVVPKTPNTPKKPVARQQPAPRALTGPSDTTRALIQDVAGSDVVGGHALTTAEVANLVNTGGDATPVPMESEATAGDTPEWSEAGKAQALAERLTALRARAETVHLLDDAGFKKLLGDAQTALDFATEYTDSDFLTEAETALQSAEGRFKTLAEPIERAAEQVKATLAAPEVSVEPAKLATSAAKAVVTPLPEVRVAPAAATPVVVVTSSRPTATPAKSVPPVQKVAPATVTPGAERLEKIAKERAIRAALEGAVRQSQALSGQDFRTKVAPFRDGLTRKLAVACGMPEPDDQILRNPTKRAALFAEIKATVQAAIGEADTRRLLPYFISSPSN